MKPIARVAALWRYPVKSMHGQPLASAALTPHGLAGDRRYAFESSGAPPGMLRLTGRGRGEILRFRAETNPAGETAVLAPDGHLYGIEEAALRDHLTLVFNDTHALTLTESPTPQTDCRPLSFISLETVRHLSEQLGQTIDPRRFRANLYLESAQPGGQQPFWEDALVGHLLRIGPEASVRVLERDPRCRFITLDPETAEPLPGLMKLLDRHHQTRAGVYASIAQAGPIALDDSVFLTG